MDLPEEIQRTLNPFRGDGGSHGIGICYHSPESGFVTLPHYGCAPEQRSDFMKSTPDTVCLYGGTLVTELHCGWVGSPDRRAGGRVMGTAHGWARASENPMRVVRREAKEEMCVWLDGMDLPPDDPRHKKRVQLVPPGIPDQMNVPMLNLSLTSHRVVGELEYIGTNHSLGTKVVEFLFRWDLRPHISPEEEWTLLRMVWTERMDANGSFLGSNFLVRDRVTNEYVGTFCGQQPLLDVRRLAPHGAVTRYRELVCNS